MSIKLKVALICHFSNTEIRERLPLSNRKLTNYIKKTFKKGQTQEYSDFSPWVTNLIKEFEKLENIELHIISPHRGLKKATKRFVLRGVNYYFFKPDIPLFHIDIPIKIAFGKDTQFPVNRFFIKRFIKRINPDIINLIGTENPYYSIASLDIKDIPVYVSVQTVYTNPLRKKYSTYDELNWDVEIKLHKKELYYGCSGRMHRDLILKNNPKAIIFKMFFPIEKPIKVKNLPKIYDFVFFAGIAKKKGVEDVLEALAIVKKNKETVTLNIIGSTTDAYMSFLEDMIDKLELNNNVTFDSYFPKHSVMFQHVVKSKFAVLPIKLDVIPGSVIEAIYLGLPVLTYKTTGTPYLNKEGEAVLIGDIGDIEALANNMLLLLDNQEVSDKLTNNALKLIEKEFNNTISAIRLVNNYKAVIDNYHNNIPIPKEQLFSVKEFPIY